MKASKIITTASLGIACALVLTAAVTADELAPLKQLSPDGGSACFGRVYDADHLKAHPRQKVARIFFYYGPDPVSRPSEDPSDGLRPRRSRVAESARTVSPARLAERETEDAGRVVMAVLLQEPPHGGKGNAAARVKRQGTVLLCGFI